MLAVIGLCFLVGVAFSLDETTIVRIESGAVKGYLQDGDMSSKFYSFRGVPYSKQPIGDLRLEPLQPADNWTDVYDAAKEAPICIQRRQLISAVYLQHQIMDEACLGVNIHVPANRESDELLPVLVFIHGAGFNYFSSDPDIYGPEFLVAKDVVVVTFNYRINLLGYLSLNTSEAPGNLGLKDALFLLNWVQRNIASFGGNPDEVTLGGQSSGAASVHLLMMLPEADGLFKRVLMQSGNALGSFVLVYPAYQAQLLTALKETLDIATNDTREIFNILKTIDFETLRNATDTILDSFGLVSFVPVVEQKFDGTEAAIYDYPYSEMIAGNYRDIPQMIGFTSDECLTFEYRLQFLDFLSLVKTDLTKLIPTDILLTSDDDEIQALTEQFLSKYFSDGSVDDDDLSNYQRLCTDSLFKYPTLRYAQFSAQNKKQPTYLYEFTYSGRNNLVTKVVGAPEDENSLVQTGFNVCGVQPQGHADDLNYIFKPNFYNTSLTLLPDSEEELTKNRIVEMWSNFIKTGNPTPGKSELINVEWLSVNSEELNYLEIDAELSLKTDPYPELINFYDQFYPLNISAM